MPIRYLNPYPWQKLNHSLLTLVFVEQAPRKAVQSYSGFAVQRYDALAGEYTTEDMAAGDTVFGDHEELIARVPKLMESTQKAISDGQHPLIVAAKWHGYYEYLHPFRDGNGRTGRLLSNFILLKAGHPLLIIKLEDRSEYISALKQIRTEGTDEHLVAFFFKTAIDRMKSELAQKRKNTLPTMFF